jgi:hypothetical protein
VTKHCQLTGQKNGGAHDYVPDKESNDDTTHTCIWRDVYIGTTDRWDKQESPYDTSGIRQCATTYQHGLNSIQHFHVLFCILLSLLVKTNTYYHETSQSGQQVSGPRFEPSISRTWSRSANISATMFDKITYRAVPPLLLTSWCDYHLSILYLQQWWTEKYLKYHLF